MARGFDLSAYGIGAPDVLYNPSLGLLYEDGVVCDGEWITSSGALATNSGDRTSRSPRDKRLVATADGESDIDWGSVNIRLTDQSFESLRRQAVDYFNTCGRLYVIDGFAGWDPAHRIKIRVLCSRPYHALFMRNMLVRPTAAELAAFRPDYVLYNAGQSPANPKTPGVTSAVSVSISLEHEEIVILGTDYAGEMKKAIFTLLNYLMPRRDALSLHCAANEGEAGDVSLFLGLSGTGKTTLSTDPRRKLIGDDQHCWTASGVSNFEGGCYAKCLSLSETDEPEIYRALRFGAVLENVVIDSRTRDVAFDDDSLTENTRAAYPIEHIPRAKIPCVGGHPSHVILLTCDAFGVLPPVSRLTPEQAIYHFLSGYTSTFARGASGAVEPQATFSACYGAAFLAWHPTKYADLLAKRLRDHAPQLWLVNTGWAGGPHRSGKRLELAQTRAIIDAIHAGELRDVPTVEDTVFGLAVPTRVRGVPSELLQPDQTWGDAAAYRQAAETLAAAFQRNFQAFAAQVDPAIVSAGPRAAVGSNA
jgi:phosphoenolpyruvate carboxykinase (ATP)